MNQENKEQPAASTNTIEVFVHKQAEHYIAYHISKNWDGQRDDGYWPIDGLEYCDGVMRIKQRNTTGIIMRIYIPNFGFAFVYLDGKYDVFPYYNWSQEQQKWFYMVCKKIIEKEKRYIKLESDYHRRELWKELDGLSPNPALKKLCDIECIHSESPPSDYSVQINI